MTRYYLLPKALVIFFVTIMFYRPLTWYNLLIIFVLALIISAIYQILDLLIRGKYYLYLEKKGKIISKEKKYSVVHRIIGLANRVMKMNVFVSHYERFDPKKTYLIIPNHQSNADATVLMEAFDTPISFVSKFSMSKAPLVADWMKLIGCLFLDKDDMRGQIKVMSEVANSLNKGNSVIIFPEGKRSFSPEMNEFRPGTFKMATKTKVDILPVTLNHVYKLKDRYPLKTTDVHVYIHDAIPYEEYKDLSTQEIASKVQSIIASKIEKE